jgi:hypothetical protein
MRRLAAFLTLALVSTSLACGSDKVTGPTVESLVGTWNLSTVNGAPLPFTYRAADPKLELLSDQFVTFADGTFTATQVVRVTDVDGVSTQTFPDFGVWALSGTAILFQFSDNSVATATAGGDTFTFAGGGVSQVYVKQ